MKTPLAENLVAVKKHLGGRRDIAFAPQRFQLAREIRLPR